MRSRIRFALAAALAFAAVSNVAGAYAPSVADLDAEARAVGNRRELAERIGESIFATEWPAEVSQVSANEIAGHLLVGIRIWGVKFHRPITRDEFLDEVITVVRRAFAAAPAAEEVDLWASVPIDVDQGRNRERRSGQADVAHGLQPDRAARRDRRVGARARRSVERRRLLGPAVGARSVQGAGVGEPRV